jgi:hypothetical protein
MKPKLFLLGLLVAVCATSLFVVSADACWRWRFRRSYTPCPPIICYDTTGRSTTAGTNGGTVTPPWQPQNKFEAELGAPPKAPSDVIPVPLLKP